MKQTILSRAALCLLLGAACPLAHAQPAVPPTDTALHWSGAGGATHVFLLPDTRDPAKPFRLFVTGGGDRTVFYRTQVNSTTDVRKELLPKEPAPDGLREYEFAHRFSRRTIWMALEFMKGGARDDELTRTFYGGLGNVVPGEEYLKGKTEK